MLGTNDEPLEGNDATQLRAFWGDEPDAMDQRRFSEPMRHAQRAWSRVEAYRVTHYRAGLLSALIVG